MRVAFLLFLLAIGLGRCSSPKVQDESVRAIGVLGYKDRVGVGDSSYLLIPRFNVLVFQYHDTVFEVECARSGNRTCYRIDYNPRQKILVDSLFGDYDRGRRLIPLEKYRGSCAPDIIYLATSGSQTVLSGLGYPDIVLLLGKVRRSKIAPSKEPRIFEAKICEFEARYLRHYFSEKYLYKEFRVERMFRWKFTPPQ